MLPRRLFAKLLVCLACLSVSSLPSLQAASGPSTDSITYLPSILRAIDPLIQPPPGYEMLAFAGVDQPNPDQSTGNIYLINTDGSGFIKLTNGGLSLIKAVRWSPDGRYLAINKEYNGSPLSKMVYLIDVINRTPPFQLPTGNPFTEDNYFLAWSPDSSQLIIGNEKKDFSGWSQKIIGNLQLYTLANNQISQITSYNYWVSFRSLSWSKVTNRLAVYDWYQVNNYYWYSHFFTINPDGSGEISLTSIGSEQSQLEWSPDGSKLLFLSNQISNYPGQYDLFVINADGTGLQALTSLHSVKAAHWSLDGTQIVYLDVINGATGYWIVNANGGSPRLITDNIPSHNLGFSWTLDGDAIIFSDAADQSSTLDTVFYVVPIDGSASWIITPNPPVEILSVPDVRPMVP